MNLKEEEGDVFMTLLIIFHYEGGLFLHNRVSNEEHVLQAKGERNRTSWLRLTKVVLRLHKKTHDQTNWVLLRLVLMRRKGHKNTSV